MARLLCCQTENDENLGVLEIDQTRYLIVGIGNIPIESPNLAPKCPVLFPSKIASAARREIIEENHRPEFWHGIGRCTAREICHIVGQFLQQTLDTLR